MPDVPRPPSPSRSSAGSSHSARTHRPGYSYGPPPSLPPFSASTSREKRPRLDPQPLSEFAPSIPALSAVSASQADKPSASLDPASVRELSALFFAHVYPARLMFHAPSFIAHLASGRVPPYLLHAICAVAAPLSPHKPQSSAPRAAGMEHFIAAQAMLTERGVLKKDVAATIEVVQALCLLNYHERVASFPWRPSVDCFSEYLSPFVRCYASLFPAAWHDVRGNPSA